jgi:hypothetical protein
MIYCAPCSQAKGRTVQHHELANCPLRHPKRRNGYYSPMSGKRLRRHMFDRLVPWWLRWLFGWR